MGSTDYDQNLYQPVPIHPPKSPSEIYKGFFPFPTFGIGSMESKFDLKKGSGSFEIYNPRSKITQPQ